MKQTVFPSKAQSSPQRYSTPLRVTKEEKRPKLNTEEIINSWTVKTNIIQKIKTAKHPWDEIITPDMALDLLTLNDPHHNRHPNWDKIYRYVDLMVSGEWGQDNGDTITIGSDMKLIDGQNRLWAVYISKVPLLNIIAPNKPPKTFASKDLGENRNAAHMATIAGFGNHANELAYIVKNILYYKKTGQVKGAVSHQMVPNHKVTEFFENKKEVSRLNKELEYAKNVWMRKTNKKLYFTSSQWVIAFYLLRSLPGMEDEARVFMEKFADGSELKANSPIKKAKNLFDTEFSLFSLNKQKKRNTAPQLTIKLNTLFTAWNHHVNKETLSGDIKIDVTTKYVVKPNWRPTN
jgi:hypothetical protein